MSILCEQPSRLMRGRLLELTAGVFGLLIGSFLNVCVYRIPRDMSIVAPRSFCPECGQQIAWYDNVPLVSYAALCGRSRCCAKPISARYPLVELATAAIFVGVALRYGWTLATLKWMIFEAILIVLFCTDLEERILPDEFTLGGAALGLVLAIFIQVPGVFGEIFIGALHPVWRSLLNAAFGAVLLAIPIWLLAIGYERVRKREGLGLGDVKLLVLLGVFLGIEDGVTALMIGAVTGSIIGLVYLALRRKAALAYELPFGSFLCAGAALLPLIGKAGYALAAN